MIAFVGKATNWLAHSHSAAVRSKRGVAWV
jgi:hypothetical protein